MKKISELKFSAELLLERLEQKQYTSLNDKEMIKFLKDFIEYSN